MMILDSKNIKYTVIDITEPTQNEEKDFMQTNATEKGITVSDADPRHPLPPQIFNGTEYCGDYNGFELANECDILEQFLKLEVQQNGSSASAPNPVAEPAPLTETNGNGNKNGDVDASESVEDTTEEVKDEPATPVEESTNEPAAEDPAPAAEANDGDTAGDSGAADSGAGDSGAGDSSAD